ncbi:MAG: DUF2461 domain-containing protein [Gammaproteobacteria bacterium]|nr:DUF2461 domain-containing protein [Gammaproteobacteria bacterium]
MTKNNIAGFEKTALTYLKALGAHNNRDWFNNHKDRYEAQVREPARAFVRAMAPRLARISPHFTADDRKVGGSLMRIYRDTRFGTDKTPYKTNVGIQFRHAIGRDVHAPGFYVHIEATKAFIGAGVWRPDSTALYRIRSRIDEERATWLRIIGAKAFVESFHQAGDSLKTSPKGFPKDHPLIDELRRKDFIAVHDLPVEALLGPSADALVARKFRAAAKYVQFLCEALDLDF